MGAKDDERSCLDAFWRSRPDLQPTDLVEHERPDFVASLNGARLGIELTRYSAIHKAAGHPEEQDSLRTRVMELARHKYEDRGGVPLHVHAIFSHQRPLSKRRVPELASEIASLLLLNTPALHLYESSDLSYITNGAPVRELASLSATRVPSPDHGVWYAARGGWVRHATREDVVQAASPKEPLVPIYRSSCDLLWLVIVFPLVGNDTYVRCPADPVSFAVETGFDRVFCLEPMGSRSVEIPAGGEGGMPGTLGVATG